MPNSPRSRGFSCNCPWAVRPYRIIYPFHYLTFIFTIPLLYCPPTHTWDSLVFFPLGVYDKNFVLYFLIFFTFQPPILPRLKPQTHNIRQRVNNVEGRILSLISLQPSSIPPLASFLTRHFDAFRRTKLLASH